jgi:hypothetical protein
MRTGDGEARRPGLARPARQEQTDAVLSTGHPYLDPFIAVVALGVIVLICRWVFSTDHRTTPATRPSAPADFGLLEQVAVVRTREDAEMLREVLRDAGIRGSVTATDGGFAVLVFRADAGAARSLVRSS